MAGPYDTSPTGTPGGRQNWVDETGGLPPFMRAIVHALRRQGKAGNAYRLAWGILKNFAAGHDGHGHKVSAKTQTKAVAALAQLSAMRAASHARSAGAKLSATRGDAVTTIDLAPTQAKRDRAKEAGHALPDGSFPIENGEDLRKAIHLAGNATDPAKARRFICKRAKALGLDSMIPSSWNTSDYSTPIDLAEPKWSHGWVPLNDAAKRVAAARKAAGLGKGGTVPPSGDPVGNIKAFQQRYGLPVTGKMDAATKAKAATVTAKHKGNKHFTRAAALNALGQGNRKKAKGLLDRRAKGLAARAAREKSMHLSVLIERANAIEDPEARGAARQQVVDLAARWKHGWIPLNAEAMRIAARSGPGGQRSRSVSIAGRARRRQLATRGFSGNDVPGSGKGAGKQLTESKVHSDANPGPFKDRTDFYTQLGQHRDAWVQAHPGTTQRSHGHQADAEFFAKHGKWDHSGDTFPKTDALKAVASETDARMASLDKAIRSGSEAGRRAAPHLTAEETALHAKFRTLSATQHRTPGEQKWLDDHRAQATTLEHKLFAAGAEGYTDQGDGFFREPTGGMIKKNAISKVKAAPNHAAQLQALVAKGDADRGKLPPVAEESKAHKLQPGMLVSHTGKGINWYAHSSNGQRHASHTDRPKIQTGRVKSVKKAVNQGSTGYDVTFEDGNTVFMTPQVRVNVHGGAGGSTAKPVSAMSAKELLAERERVTGIPQGGKSKGKAHHQPGADVTFRTRSAQGDGKVVRADGPNHVIVADNAGRGERRVHKSFVQPRVGSMGAVDARAARAAAPRARDTKGDRLYEEPVTANGVRIGGIRKRDSASGSDYRQRPFRAVPSGGDSGAVNFKTKREATQFLERHAAQSAATPDRANVGREVDASRNLANRRVAQSPSKFPATRADAFNSLPLDQRRVAIRQGINIPGYHLSNGKMVKG